MGASSQLVFDWPLPIFPPLPAPSSQTFWHLCEGKKGQVLGTAQVQGLLRGVEIGDQHSSVGVAGAGWEKQEALLLAWIAEFAKAEKGGDCQIAERTLEELRGMEVGHMCPWTGNKVLKLKVPKPMECFLRTTILMESPAEWELHTPQRK